MSNQITKLFNKIIKNIILNKIIKGEAASDLIQMKLNSIEPMMISRFGSVEIKGILYPFLPFFLKKIVKNKIFYDLYTSAGFFPVNEESVTKFSNLMIYDMKLVDVLGSWRSEEYFFKKYLLNVIKVNLSDLEPYFHNNPWTISLENKKILVIHPFNTSIEEQYHNNRDILFSNKNILPKFKSLETIKAIQTIAGSKSKYNDWFEALDYMKSEIDNKDFDIAIIGCGAYGFPLAAHVKRIGKKAIHLGGATQILFGIKGKRWLDKNNYDHIINDHFIFPNDVDKVDNYKKVEGGAYW
jgi:hypothetical protein